MPADGTSAAFAANEDCGTSTFLGAALGQAMRLVRICNVHCLIAHVKHNNDVTLSHVIIRTSMTLPMRPMRPDLRLLARLCSVFFAVSALSSNAVAQDGATIERLMESAMPPGAICSKGKHPSTCEFKKSGIGYDIEYSHGGDGHAAATIKFVHKDEYRPYLDLLMKFLTTFGFSRAYIDSCVAEALDATARSVTGRAEINSTKFLMTCDFYGQGNSTFKTYALVLELTQKGRL